MNNHWRIKRLYKKLDKVIIKSRNNIIGIVEDVIYEAVNGKRTDNIYAYVVTIGDKHGILVYPDEID